MEDIKHPATKPAPYYEHALEGLNENSLKQYLSVRGLGEPGDMESFIAATDAASFTERGGSVEESFKAHPDDPANAVTIQELLKSVDFNKLSGKTPLEKGSAFTAVLKSEGGMEAAQEAAKNGKSLDGLKKRLNQRMAEMGTLKSNEFAKDALEMSGEQPELKLPSLRNYERQILSSLKELEKIGEIQSKRPSKPIKDTSGTIVKQRMMEDYDELTNLVDPSDIFMPDFEINLVNHELMVEENWKVQYLKRIAALLLDRSGSMWASWKQAYVAALQLFYFERLRTGEIEEIYISTFEQKIDGWVKITSEQQAKKYYKEYRCSGGGLTEVGECVKTAQLEIKEGRLGNYTFHIDAQPELLVINDGQDYVDPQTQLYAPLHAITLEEDNLALKQLCGKFPGGSYNHFNGLEQAYRF